MIPYIELTSFSIGPITIQVWGLLVALGMLAGAKAAAMMARVRGLQETIVWDLAVWVIVGAMLMARVFMLLYEPGYYLADPLEFFRVWHGGFSIMGGFVGAVIAGVWFLRKRQVDVHAYADVVVFGLPLGLFIGRIGCFLIHDHPGTLTDFVMGVQYPDGVRHDHGLYLSLNGLLMFLVFLWMAKRKVQVGMFIVVFLMWYGTVRFFLDFLRATDGAIVDSRYLSLTPAQYISLMMIAAGGWYWWRLSKQN